MTSVTKSLLTTSLILAVSLCYQIHSLIRQRVQSQMLTRKTADLNIEIQRVRAQRDRTLIDLSAAQDLMDSVQLPTDRPGQDSGLSAWLTRVKKLEQCLLGSPERQIPEMKYLNSNDWLSVTLDNPLRTDAEVRMALSKLRALAKAKPEIATNLSNALQSYRKSNNGLLPSNSAQLRPYLDPPLSDEVLSRYGPAPEVAGENDAHEVTRDGFMFLGSGRVALQEKTPVDEDYDTWIGFLEKGGWATGRISQLGTTVSGAIQDFAQTNNGQAASTLEQLLPYLPTSIDRARLKEYWEVTRH